MSIGVDTFNEAAWYDFIQWALSDDMVLSEFEKDTKIKRPSPAKTPIDRLIDDATGYQLDFIKKFVVWVTENFWGVDEAPQIYFEKFGGKQ